MAIFLKLNIILVLFKLRVLNWAVLWNYLEVIGWKEGIHN